MKTPKALYYKAIKLKKRLSPEEEQIISTSPEYSYYYARDVIRCRWPQAEDIIKNSGYWLYYQYRFEKYKGEFEVEEILNS